VDRFFLTGDEFKYAPEKRLNGQSEVFYFTANDRPSYCAGKGFGERHLQER